MFKFNPLLTVYINHNIVHIPQTSSTNISIYNLFTQPVLKLVIVLPALSVALTSAPCSIRDKTADSSPRIHAK